MLIWINGAFGAGKTKVARRLVASLPRAWLFDPERIGFMLQSLWPGADVGDFQDLPIWRELTVAILTAAADRNPDRIPIVPMTLVDKSYFREIMGELSAGGREVRHFTLVASPKTLRRRIRWRIDRPASKRWAQAQVARCCASLADPMFAEHVPTDGRKVADIAREILVRIDG
ncbi:MAG: AAA family ATPase [Sphingomonadaceae bacterium]|nr:AAA family ATPase [Sphingomonadaceae bacterium]